MPQQSATLPAMGALIAHVRNGQLVFDEPVKLAEGTRVKVLVDEVDDGYTDEEREALLKVIDASHADIKAGRTVDADEFLDQLDAEP